MTEIPVQIKNIYHAIELTKIKYAVYDFSYLLREALILQTPKFIECNQGVCPERDELHKYLKRDKKEDQSKQNFPFSKLNSKKNKEKK